jgi:UDP-N-acetylmuramate dehydrogenase
MLPADAHRDLREGKTLESEHLADLIPADLRDNVRPEVSLATLTTLRVGGPAGVLCPVRNADDARRFQELAATLDLPHTVLGGGSNILAADEGYRGLVLQVATREFAVQGDTVTVGCGLDFDDLIARSLAAGLTGLEFASGIPGTLGGALVGNAGCYGHEIGEFLVDALVLTPTGRLETVGPEDFAFRYRNTALRGTGHLVLEARLRLVRGDLQQAGSLRTERIADRRSKHPVDLPSAGSWFRNLPPAAGGGRRQPAGALLEQAGAKDMREGDAAVFPRHANIIVNLGRATSAEIARLAGRMRTAVRERFGVELVEEIRRLATPPDGPA